MNAWVAVIAVGLLSYVYRGAVTLGWGDRPLPASLTTATTFVAPAMIAALIGSALAPTAGLSADDVRLAVVALVGGVVALRSGSMAATVGVGLAVHAAVGLVI